MPMLNCSCAKFAATYRLLKMFTVRITKRNTWTSPMNVISVERSRFQVHVRKLYNETQFLLCFLSFARFTNKPRIKFHMREQHVKVDKTAVCNVCGKVLKNRRSLATHYPVHFEDLKNRFKCSVCGKGYPKKDKLKVSRANDSVRKIIVHAILISAYSS